MRKTINHWLGSIQCLLAGAISYLPVGRLRIHLLRLIGADIGRGTAIAHGLQMRVAHRVSIGRDVFVSEGVLLDGRGGLQIGASTSIGSDVQIWTAQHDWKSLDFIYASASVKIGHHVWIGPRVIVLPGVEVADGCVLAAGAVVTKSTDAYGLYAGVPARRIGERPSPMQYEQKASRAKMLFW